MKMLLMMGISMGILMLETLAGQPAPARIVVAFPQETKLSTPVSTTIDLAWMNNAGGDTAAFQLVPFNAASSLQADPIPAQFIPDAPGARTGTLWSLLPPGPAGPRHYTLTAHSTPDEPRMRGSLSPNSGQWEITESGRPVLRYNYQTNDPGDLLLKVSPDNRKYARARSDYIHPLYGLHGEELTKDWSVDHPHHRGIYWAWPEVDYRTERGDLHALQRVFSRPAGNCRVQEGTLFARIEADNIWNWEDRESIVRERAIIQAWRTGSSGRLVDLEFHFTALVEGVTIARRDTDKYGGLNIRLAAVDTQEISFHTDAPGLSPRRAYADLSGLFKNSQGVTGLAVIQNPANPDYPGDWIKYPELNWFQPTFPAAGTRYPLTKNQLLVLKFRLWIHGGRAGDPDLVESWSSFANPPQVKLEP